MEIVFQCLENSYMALLCYKNGSLTREKIRDCSSSGIWAEFNNALKRTQPGNDGCIGIYFIDQEIIPNARGIYRWNAKDERVQTFSPDNEVRALIEGQFVAKKIHAEKLGYNLGKIFIFGTPVNLTFSNPAKLCFIILTGVF